MNTRWVIIKVNKFKKNLLCWIVGALVTWQTLAGISCLVPCAALLAILFYPESPNFLVSQNKPEAAKAALKRFRGSTCNVEAELNTLVNFSQKNNVHKLHGWKGKSEKINRKIKVLSRKKVIFLQQKRTMKANKPNNGAFTLTYIPTLLNWAALKDRSDESGLRKT